MHEVKVVTTEPTPTAVVARTTTWQEFPSLWGTLLDEVYAFVRGGGATQAGHNVMLYLDGTPTVEVGVQVKAPFASDGPVVSSTLPAGEAAMTVHRGEYGGLGDAHQAVVDWCTANGRERVGVRWEIYGDWHEDPEQMETEVYWLLVS